MSLRINQNILSIRTHGALSQTSSSLERSIERLSSGLRINRAADDAAGLAISEKMRRQVRGLSRAILNAQDGVSMVQSAEGALNESHSILQRMRELAVQAGNGTLTSGDRLEVQREVNQLRDDLNRIARNTEFNTKRLLDGSQSALVSSSSPFVSGHVVGDTRGGGDYSISMALVQGGISQLQRSRIFVERGSTRLARGDTKLRDIAQFYDANGQFILANPQTLSLTGNAKSSLVHLDGEMTLDHLAGALQSAMTSSSGLGVTGSRVGVVGTATTGLAGVGGYLQVQSGAAGDNGNVAFAGHQRLIDSLGMSIVRRAENSVTEINVTDGLGGVRSLRTGTDRASGLLEGIDLTFRSQAAQIAGTQGLQTGINITAAQTFTVNTVTVTVDVGMWSLEGIARSIGAQTAAAGFSAGVVDGQIRLTFVPPIPGSPTSFNITGAASGARTLNFRDGAHWGFTDSIIDTTKQIVGFSAYRNAPTTPVTFDIGDGTETTVITVFNTVSGVLTADLIDIRARANSVNETLRANDVDVRMDAVGGTIAFTALRIGQENTSTGSVRSMVTLAATDLEALQLFGVETGSSQGIGDTNFRLRVVDNKPQFQIGADRGQTMQVSMGDMTAAALGVSSLDLTSVDGANQALSRINRAIDTVSGERSKLGAFQNRLEFSINNLRSTHSNIVAAESRIRDADIALEMIQFTRHQIMAQSGTAMLAQANLVPQGVLQLLR